MKREYQYDVLTVTTPVNPTTLARLQNSFRIVHFHPNGEVPLEALRRTEVFFTPWEGVPRWITRDMIPNARLVQLTSAGANQALLAPCMLAYQDNAVSQKSIQLCTASGIHTSSIAQYAIAQIVNLYINLAYIETAGNLKNAHAITDPASQRGMSLIRGKTVGFLGYGHIGRETARLLKPFGVDIIAANSSGRQRADDGYIIKGTGDVDGSLPSQYYSTDDGQSFTGFLSRSDILISSLPSTPSTRHMLTGEHFAHRSASLPDGCLFINVGRGDIARSEEILKSLRADGGLAGCVLDVTEPEPLPAEHELRHDPRVIITPHISGVFDGYFDAGVDVLLANVDRDTEHAKRTRLWKRSRETLLGPNRAGLLEVASCAFNSRPNCLSIAKLVTSKICAFQGRTSRPSILSTKVEDDRKDTDGSVSDGARSAFVATHDPLTDHEDWDKDDDAELGVSLLHEDFPDTLTSVISGVAMRAKS